MSEKLSKACLILTIAGEEASEKRGKVVGHHVKEWRTPPAHEYGSKQKLRKGSNRICEGLGTINLSEVSKEKVVSLTKSFPFPMTVRSQLSPEFLPPIPGLMKSSSTYMKNACTASSSDASTETLVLESPWLSKYCPLAYSSSTRPAANLLPAISSSCPFAKRIALPCQLQSSSTSLANMTNIRICSSRTWRSLMLYDEML